MGGAELLIILAIILLFFGARWVPQLGRSLGQSLREFRKGAAGEDEEVRQLPSKDKEKPSLNGAAAYEEPSRTKGAEATRTEQGL
jgi:sec-independent protein translocase protein TatA